MLKFSFLVMLVTVSCGSTENETNRLIENLDSTSVSSDSITNQQKHDVIDSSLIHSHCLHIFSNPETPDSFRIAIYGDNIESGEAIFTIHSGAEKDLLFEDKFPAMYLTDMMSIGSDITPEAEITGRIHEFFDEASFSMPAIGKEEEFLGDLGGNFADRNDWEDIRSDQTSVGFHFLIGKANGQSIAYSKRLKKVVVYATCC